MKIAIWLLLFCGPLMANTKDLYFKNLKINWLYKTQFKQFDQIVDHNSTQKIPATFKQRFWQVDTYAANAESPVIIDICGEATCNGPGPATLQAAKILGARVFALEHRYYGESYPVKDLTTKSLAFLTIEQALKDLVYFKKAMERDLELSGPWISIGGSYAGALSAYLRNQYPEDFAGALASSGPVRADLDFSEYDAHVAKVAGKECQNAILEVVAEVEKNILTEATFAQEKVFFGVKTLKQKEDFLYLLADTAAGAIQYGMKDQFCDLVVAEGRTGYAKAVSLVSSRLGDLESMSAQAAEVTKIDTTQDVGMRQWFYQSCTEFGFWQNVNANPSLRTRSTAINASFHNKICQRLFGLKAQDVEKTNKKYYEPLLLNSASNILFTNGEQDPWSVLSLLKTSNPKLAVHMIAGAAHCDDLRASGSAAVMQAKKIFFELAKKWVVAE